ncbi:MAG TPA: hypothetical protein VMS08_04725, partial [Candidatus Saccharimonadia bacterium]|nr:hypothetical protein [Candidatus Saccharimonadia bacterium]
TADEVIEADDPEPPPPPQPSPVSSAKTGAKRPMLIKRRDLSDAPPPPTPPTEADSSMPADVPTPGSAKKPPKVPNYGRLQKRLLWVVLAIFLIVGYTAGMYYLSSAKVTLFTNGTRVDVTASFAVDPNAQTSTPSSQVLAGHVVTASKDLSGSFTPTGKQDAGSKASGSMIITNGLGVAQPLVAGTRFEAPDGNILLSEQDVTVPPATLDSGGNKINGSATIQVTAQQNGDTYNEAPTTYTIPALNNSKVTAQGSQMSGGVTKTVNVVTQPDVDTEQAALLTQNQSNVSKALAAQVPSGYMALTSSQSTAVSNISPSPAVGAVGNTGTLQIHVTYTELAVKTSDLSTLLQAAELTQVGSGNQIYDSGLSGAQYTAGNKDGSGRQTFQLAATAYSGAKLNLTTIASQLKGKRYGDAVNLAQGLPGVSQATVSIWPGWASSLPARAAKIKIVIQVSKQ